MSEIENKTVVDSEFEHMEKEYNAPNGYFTQLKDTFVREEYILEYALEKTQEDSYYRDSFLEKVLDHIEKNEDAKEKFLKWFYPDYKEEQ